MSKMQEIAFKPAAIFSYLDFNFEKKFISYARPSFFILKGNAMKQNMIHCFRHINTNEFRKTHGTQVEMCQTFCGSSIFIVQCSVRFCSCYRWLFFASNNLPKFAHLVTTLFVHDQQAREEKIMTVGRSFACPSQHINI